MEESKCPHCESELKTHKAKFDIFTYCDSCYGHVARVDRPECCHAPDLAEGVYIIANGNRVLRHHCRTCKTMSRINLKSRGRDLSRVPEINKALHDQSQKLRYQEWERFYNRFQEVRKEKFLDQYSVYLNSAKWKAKRLLVLKRDNHICQSCLRQEASQVHHLSYKHLYNEPLFELVSVCEACHDSITAMDRNEEYAEINH